MRRLLIALMTLMVAVQFSWAAAAGYCGHEATAGTATHIGHHAHSHGGEGQKLPLPLSVSVPAELDHGHCHLVHAAIASSSLPGHAFKGQSAPPTVDTCLADSHIPDGLDRPNWQRA